MVVNVTETACQAQLQAQSCTNNCVTGTAMVRHAARVARVLAQSTLKLLIQTNPSTVVLQQVLAATVMSAGMSLFLADPEVLLQTLKCFCRP